MGGYRHGVGGEIAGAWAEMSHLYVVFMIYCGVALEVDWAIGVCIVVKGYCI